MERKKLIVVPVSFPRAVDKCFTRNWPKKESSKLMAIDIKYNSNVSFIRLSCCWELKLRIYNVISQAAGMREKCRLTGEKFQNAIIISQFKNCAGLRIMN